VKGPPDPPLADGDLLLRPFTDADLDPVARAFLDPDVLAWFLAEDQDRSPQQFLRRQEQAWASGTGAGFAVCPAHGDCVGAVFLEPRGRGIFDIGYWLLPEARGHGFAARATRRIARWALTDLGAARVQLWTEPENRRSQRVAEIAGFQREGVLRAYGERQGTRVDAVFYSLIPADL
jgi:[ribosomal protein S5]-alanine N-acetyltransferase